MTIKEQKDIYHKLRKYGFNDKESYYYSSINPDALTSEMIMNKMNGLK